MATESPDLEWREEAPSLWVRPLDRTELHFVGMQEKHGRHGKEWGMLSTILHLETPLKDAEFVAAVRQAWQWVRHRHPMIGSTLDSGREQISRLYRIASDQELQSWLLETLLLHDTEGPDSAARYRLLMQPAKRVTLHVFPQSQELLLQASHHFVDGHSLVRLSDLILNLMANPSPVAPEFGTEHLRLAPAPAIAAHIAPVPTPAGQAAAQTAINEWIAGFPSSGIGASDIQSAPGSTRTRRVQLSRDQTRAVLAAAKRSGLTATHVVEAALIVASRQTEKRLVGLTDDRNYVSCGLFSLRPWCDEAVRDESAPYVAFLPQVVGPAGFLDTARQLKGYYTHWRARGDEVRVIVTPMLETFAAMSAGATEPNQMLSVSSFGLLEPRLSSVHGEFRLRDWEFVYEVPDPGVSAFSWTRDGQLSWTICYNEVYHSEAKTEQWMDASRDILLEGLEISS